MTRILLLLASLLFLIPSSLSEEERIAILGDSIPYEGSWPTLVAEAIRQKPEFSKTPIVNISIPSETLSGLSSPEHANGAFPPPCLHERLGRIMSQFQPTIIIACYGMNDGLFQPLSKTTLEAFKKGVERLKNEADAAGAKVIFVTPPPCKIDEIMKGEPAGYDKTLSAFSSWLLSQTRKGYQVIDIRPYVKKAVALEKKTNPQFIYAQDGVHPGFQGHQFIAEAICTGLSKLLGIPANPQFPSGEAFTQAKAAQEQLKNEWLGKINHKRPEVPGYSAHIPYFRAPGAAISQWNKFERQDFNFKGRKASIVFPEKPLPGTPWIWRPQFFDYDPLVDIAMVGRGFTLAYVDMPDMYGSPEAMKIMTEFYEYVTTNYALSRRPVLEPFSRGGLYAFRWAAEHPKWVSCIIANAPVCDIKSWPAGKGKGKGSPEDWNKLLASYGMTEAQAMASKTNPVDLLAPLAAEGIPILIIARTDDTVVPYQENAKILADRYQKLGGMVKTILSPGDHMDQTLKDINPVIDFIFSATKYPKPTTIVCIGDSITEGSKVQHHERWAHLLAEKLGQNYTVCNQGFSARTLLSKGDFPYTKEPMYKNAINGKYDIALIALGTNDSKPQNWKFKGEFIKDYKAMINDLRQSNPNIIIYCLKAIPSTSNEGIRGEIIEKGVNPMIEKIAAENKCNIIDLFSEMKDHTDLLPDKVHPNADGHAIMGKKVYNTIMSGKKM